MVVAEEGHTGLGEVEREEMPDAEEAEEAGEALVLSGTKRKRREIRPRRKNTWKMTLGVLLLLPQRRLEKMLEKTTMSAGFALSQSSIGPSPSVITGHVMCVL
jgi:hypothetical protein